MPLHIGIGFSNDQDTTIAARDAAFNAKSSNSQSTIKLALVFATVDYNFSEIAHQVRESLGTDQILGASTSGIILSNSVEPKGVGIMAISSDEEMPFALGQVENIHSMDSRHAGNTLAQNVLKNYPKGSRNNFLYFLDGQAQNSSTFLRGLQDVLGNAFTIVGGGSCDSFKFKESHQIYQNQVMDNGAVGLLLGGNTSLGVGGKHGWRPLGKPRRITQCHKNIIETIDHKPASEIYDNYFHEEAQVLRSGHFSNMAILYPLGIFVDRTNEYLLRNVSQINPNGHIVCQGEIPLNSEIHIMIGNKESCRQAALTAASEARKNLTQGEAKALIILESIARQKLLGRSAIKEVQDVRSVFGSDIPVFGMYTHGEVYPFQNTENIKKIHTQNESVVILAIR